jgi:hypothetical protein
MNDLVFLPEATSERLQEATAANTTAWIAQLAEVGGG